jgi:fructose 1,6-bisphosphatase
MTTEMYEVYSIEEGDQVVIGGEMYKILDILDGDETDYIIRLADEEGNVKKVCANSHQKFSVVIDNLAAI